MIWHSSSANEVIENLNVDINKGLATGVADSRLEEYGLNLINTANKTSIKEKVKELLGNYNNILVFISAVLAFIVYLLYDKSKWYYPLLILLILAVNCAISIYFSYKSEKYIESVKKKSIPRVKVLRDGILKIIEASLIVPGDILVLETGDYVAADARLISTTDFRCDEEFVTGESITTEKNANTVLNDITELKGRINMVYYGSNVISGSALAVVTETGMNTEVGKAVSILGEFDSVDIPFTDRLFKISRISSVFLLIAGIITFFINVLINFRSTDVAFAVLLAESFTTSVAFLISILPEGLSFISSIAVSISVVNLLKKDIIVKNLSAFDKLPEINAICSDKTGVLTQNRMLVTYIYNGKTCLPAKYAVEDAASATLLRLGALCTNQTEEDRDCIMYNDPTELAIIQCCHENVPDSVDDFWNRYPRLCKIPFNAERKIMTSVNMLDGKPYAIVKGAPDIILNLCRDVDKQEVQGHIKEFTSKGLRVIAVAFKAIDEIPSNPNSQDLESDLILSGLFALYDPPQTGIVSQISECDNAHIRSVMLTGDHDETARAAARRFGILKDGTEAVNNFKLDSMTDEELRDGIKHFSVFSRISPKDKLRIVKALQARRKKVAITGDTVNDATALKNADVGFASGLSGTDVARGAADVILNDNSFNSILETIKSATKLFTALRSTVTYLFSSNLGELLTILLSLIFFKCFPVSAIQLLLINLLTDAIPILSVLSDNLNQNITLKKYSGETKSLFTARSIIITAVQSVLSAVFAVIAYAVGSTQGIATANTMVFTVLILGQFFSMITLKTEKPIFNFSHFKNHHINICLLASVALLLVIVLTGVGSLFGLSALTGSLLIKAIILSLMSLVTGELIKFSFWLYNKFAK